LDAVTERIGRFEFSIVFREPERREDRVAALLAWLLSRWEREEPEGREDVHEHACAAG